MTVNLNASLTQGFGISSDTSGITTFQTNGTETMRIDTSGNVGIGTSSPGSKLDISAASNNAVARIISTDSTRCDLRFQTSGSNSGLFFGNSTTFDLGRLYYDNTGNNMVFVTNSSERMRIDSSGNVGVGTSSPSAYGAKLNISSAASNQATLFIVNPGQGSAQIGFAATGSNLKIYNSYSDGTLANGKGIDIDSNGNLLVGTTTQVGKLNVVASSNIGAGYNSYFRNTWSGDVGYPALYVAKYDNNTTTSQIFMRFSVNNETTASGQINANGANSAAFGSFSDERLKENIVDLPSQLGNICSLRPVEFDYKDGSGHQIGFVAQEVQEVYPDVVGVGADDMLTITGWSKTEARLVKAIQELKAELDALKAKVGA